MRIRNLIACVAGTVILFSACKKDDNNQEVIVAGPDMFMYGLTANNEMVIFNAKDPSTFISKTAITGIAAGEKLMSIDCRPATGEVYALSNASKLYVITRGSASARVVSATAFTPAISGTIASIDFNPTVDRIRLVTNTGQNLRLHPETGAVAATDLAINGGTTPAISGVAYTNSRAGATTTVLFDIDQASGKLYKQDPPNNGTLVEVGSLNVAFTGQAAFDISPDNANILMGLQTATGNFFYKVDLTTGAASKIGKLADALIDIAIPTDPVAYGVDLSGNLVIFNPENPGTPATKAITGLQTAETIVGIDFRPATAQLYALGSTSRLYVLNIGTGAATLVGTGALSTLLVGTDFGFDFNPTVDRIRVVSNTGQNLRLNPIDGSVTAVDGAINPGTPKLGAAAYTNNFAGATTTVLHVIDPTTDKLYQQNPPNNGTLVETGALGVDIINATGFDIGSVSGKAYLLASTASGNSIYTINLTTGAATKGASVPVATQAFTIGLGF